MYDGTRPARINHEARGHPRHWAHRLEDGRNPRADGHEVIAASPKTGVNTFAGEGLEQAVARTQV
jgi:hypothetical protein